jgi:aconitase A
VDNETGRISRPGQRGRPGLTGPGRRPRRCGSIAARCPPLPVDEVTLDYLRLTGRPQAQVALAEAYAREQGLWHDPGHAPACSRVLDLDLSAVTPSIAGPRRPQDRIPLAEAPRAFRAVLGQYAPGRPDPAGLDEAGAESFPASDPVAVTGNRDADKPAGLAAAAGPARRPRRPVRVSLHGQQAELDHGAVVIAAITSCTNTSNREVMIAAALLAKKAAERGLAPKPWVKTSLAPGSRVVMDYYDRAGLTPYLDKLGFSLVGTFANIRLRNRLAPGTEGGYTRHLPGGEQMTIHDAAQRYAAEHVPLLVIAGREYGSGSSRDWAAKGTALLGVRAVLAVSFERIHRSNLIGTGVLPLQFAPGQDAASLGLTGEETYSIRGLAGAGQVPRTVTVTAAGPGGTLEFTATVRIDTPAEAAYYQHGGILPYVLRGLAGAGRGSADSRSTQRC